MIFQAVVVILWSFCHHASTTHGFLPTLTSHRIPQGNTNVVVGRGSAIKTVVASTTRLFENKLWDRMEIEEDEEPMWYVLNCVAGLEIDLLRQCRQRCEGMEDVVKFVVPMVTNTRSHGANKMVKDTKVKYQGYVFAKLRLCPKTYEAIQGLDLCRSWMGTINYKGMRKLPPAPVALNDEEIENFGLEECEDEFSEEAESDEDDVIVDTAEADQEAAEFEETIQKVYLGLRVNDMVKVTAKNKFYDEDAIVRRLKDGKVFLRFYTYGSMYEEWMDPKDVRKLTNIEILKGLSGPQQPITQRDIDGPVGNDRRGRYDDDGRPGDLRRNLQDSFGGGPRNRRQDRTAQRFQRDMDRDRQQKGEDNWNWYKENERRNEPGGYDDGEFLEIRGSSERSDPRRSNRDDAWTQGDVDSQWGRTNPREKRQEKRQPQRMKDDGGDWSAFVSPTKQRPSKDETDDFFASLMTDLSKDLASERRSTGPSRNSKSNDLASEDDFFASLISEIEQESSPSPPGKGLSSLGSDEDDFFSSLVDDIQVETAAPKQKQSRSPKKVNKKASTTSDDTDFFQSLAEELESSPTTTAKSKSKNAVDELDDFFSDLDFDVNGESDDFFAGLQTDLDSELSIEPPPKPAKKSGQKKDSDKIVAPKKSTTKESIPVKTNDVATNLDKCTVPELKEMLREKGLKVTGKKSELIDRLTQS